jgi:hypothetical protein
VAGPASYEDYSLIAQLVFTIFMLAAKRHKGIFIAPVGIWSLFVRRRVDRKDPRPGLYSFQQEKNPVWLTARERYMSLNPVRLLGAAVLVRNFV